ncbi:hypothetical protein DCE79_02040 [Lysinibacillus sp. 2017]|uniref:ATP-binding protein n=1 Tax=unclassified Lysinibacillus TaxID=2636778 RepID=UPI000D525C7A|nr:MULTISPECIES: ATP-binding protein [unclassified Lysinibacillus]AWE06238.1 hypothetical protein DCE79_02040 [Lysinibacillus sp. 2017]TGN35286.1 hypothetical protein E4L99_10635 [Lysinibacillus sp. S2017]
MSYSLDQFSIIESHDDWLLEHKVNEHGNHDMSKVVNRKNKKKIAQLHYELELANELNLSTMLQPIAIEQNDQYIKLTYQSTQQKYISLAEYISASLTTYDFLKIAINITNCFIDLHQASYIYRNVHPKHFLIDPQTYDIKLYNTEHVFKYSNYAHSLGIEKELPNHRLDYVAPEETGRVTSEIDFQTDLYSLGVLFFKMISRRTPYIGDSTTLLNKMLTTSPPTFTELGIKVPAIIEKIIQKLLSKNKENRYQSAIGVKEDLALCWYRFTNKLPLSDFELAMQDNINQRNLNVIIPTRQRMINELSKQIEQYQEQQQIHLLKGKDGAGKSYALLTMYKSCLAESRFVLQFAKDTKHAKTKIPVFLLAYRQQFMRFIEVNEQTRHNWKQRLLSLNLTFPKLVLTYFPELEPYKDELNITEQQEVIEQDQLFMIFSQIIEVFHTQALPAVIIVDDWLKLDLDSQKFIEFLIKKQRPYIFLFAEQQTNDITHWLQQNNRPFIEHQILFISKEEVMEWIAYSFKSNEEALRQLAEFLFDITQGNPLFIQELFLVVCEQQVLKYDHHSHEWQFDIHASQLKGNIATFHEFIARGIEKLSQQEVIVLKYAACIGMQFDLETLLNIVPFHKEKTLQIFTELLRNRFFIARHEQVALFRTYMDFNMLGEIKIPVVFLCEDLLETTLKLVTAEELGTIHYAISSYFFSEKEQIDVEKRLLVHHLRFCQELLTKQELDNFLRLNFELGNKALKSGMFRESLSFSQVAYDVLTPAHWKNDYQLTLEVYVMHANALYLNGHKQANEIFEAALKHCEKTYDRLFVYNEKSLFYMMGQADDSFQMNLIEILQMADEALKPMNISIRTNMSTIQVAKEYLLLKSMLNKYPAYQLLNLPKTKNKTMKLVLSLLMNISGAALIVDEKLYAWINMKAIRLIIKYGEVEFASVFYGNFANILVTGFKDLKQAHRFGLLSVKHVDKYDNPFYKSNVYMNYGITISYLKKSYDTSIYYLAQTQKYHLNNSLHHLFNAMASAYTLNFMLVQGAKLTMIKEEYNDQKIYLEATNNRLSQVYANEIVHWIHILQDPNVKIDWEFPVETKIRASFWESHLVLRLQMSYLLHDKQQAEALLQEIQAILNDSILTANRPQYYYYRALWNFRQLEEDLPKKMVVSLMKDIKNCMKEVKKYVQHNPQNFEHMLMLLKAQYYRFTNQITKAVLHFDRAVQLAKLANNNCDKAIALLSAALFYESQHESQKAKDYMQRAIQTLYAWQAPRVVQVWDEHYYYLRKRVLVFDQPSENQGFDIQPIVNMYQTIASESEVKELLKNSLLEIMKHLDAESIYLFTVKMDTPKVVAYANSVKEEYIYYENAQDDIVPSFMSEILQEVITSKKMAFNNEVMAKGKSVICLPIFMNGHLKALIYCSNDTIASIFTKTKIDLVTILATQMLMAKENIESKNILEQEVKERTLELVQVNNQLQQMNDRLKQNEEERKYFIQHISHDLRSPLTSVLGYVEALSDGLVKTEEQQKQYLARSKSRLLSLNHLIQDLFDIALLEGGRIEYKKEELSAKQLFALLDDSIQNGLEEKSVHYVRSFRGENGRLVVDIERITQVIDNLTSNIRKYANEGTVHFSINSTDQFIEISLSDEGQGIPEKDLPFIFDMHFSASNNHRKESHGIGLAICKQIIEHHGGSLRVSSDGQKGTTMTIRLPVLKESPSAILNME